MKIEATDKNDIKLSLEMEDKEIIIKLDDGQSSISFTGTTSDTDFIATNLKSMSKKIKTGQYECDQSS